MTKLLLNKTRQASAYTLFVFAAILTFFIFAAHSRSASPAMGSLNPSTASTASWLGAAAIGPASADETTCVESAGIGVNCDTYTITLTGTPANWAGKKAHIKISWTNTLDDFDVFVHKGSNSGPTVASSASSGAGPEELDLDPSIPSVGTGTFTVHVVYFTTVPGDTYNGDGTVTAGVAPTPTPSPGSTPTPTPFPPGTPRYFTYPAPNGYGEDAGEPSVGSNWLTENVARAGSGQTFANSNGTIPNGGTTTYYGGFLAEMLRITFDDCSSPATPFWEKKPLVLAATPRALGDPILFTDHGYPNLPGTGRTFVAQEEVQAGATTDVTDDDGDNFMPSQGAGQPSGVDHETIGAGPYASPAPVTQLYPSAVYYGAQSVSDARLSRSDDGGITFGPAIPMYTTVDCGGLHGHVKVAPDGTVYVPNNACGGTTDPVGHVDGQQAVAVSQDNGITWNVRKIPTTDTKSDRDPSVGIATDGTIYFGMQSKDGHARISVSHDRGLTWMQFPGQAQLNAYDVGEQLGIQNMVFAEVVAGDPDRAAFAFYGTTTGGTNYDQPDFPGVWYLYIASTFDGGAHWTTINATPNDPIQRGGICGAAPCRNLLDFFDATIDKEGRVLIGWDDGCVGACVNGGNNSFTAKATITRQTGGKRMFAAFDPVEPALPGAPAVSGVLNGSKVTLSWPEPDGGGSTITSYKVYKGMAGSFTLLATTTVPNFMDSTYTSGQMYRVTAVNQVGEGPYCHEFTPPTGPVASACSLPGILAVDDLTATGADNDSAQNTPADQRVNVRQLFVAEPFVSPGTEQLFFTLQVGPDSSGSAPPNSQWFIIWNRQGTAGSADPNDPNDGRYDRMYIAMRTDVAGTPTFEYGKFGHPIDTSVPPPPPDGSENVPVKFGDADSGSSYDPLSGTIKIKMSNSKFRMIDGGGSKYIAGTDLAGLNVRTYFNRPDPGQRSQNNASDITDNGTYSLVGNVSCAPPANLVSVVSRKVHGTVPYDVPLYPAGPKGGIECRARNNGNHQIVFTFSSPVTFSSASTDTGGITNTSTQGNSVTVNLDNIPNATTTMVTLNGVSTGGAPATFSVPFITLEGDTNADKRVNVGDTNQTKAQSGQPLDTENFREDVNLDGRINVADVTFVKAHSGTVLPPPAQPNPAKREPSGR